MGNLKKKKYTSGEASQYISRASALKTLQLTLKDFRKLCILKGIYPREPKNRRRAQKGSTEVKTLYLKKDIQFLMHEPIIWKLREKNTLYKKIGKYRTLKDYGSMKRLLNHQPTLKLDHIVKERYPTFLDAIRDLDDCLALCFLFSTFPSLPHIPRYQSDLCRRLTIEFMHAIIHAKALRKVFISIKGYYYQAEIKGITINWITPHYFAFQPHSKNDVDFKIMSTFIEFYIIMLGFVNFRLYHDLNLYYPPKFQDSYAENDKCLVDEEAFHSERVAALNIQPISLKEDDDIEEDELIQDFGDDNKEQINEREQIKNLKTLFKGLKFFINREVPREPLVFIIRCFGGEVSWDKTLFVGATFQENDETITHQICDRKKIDKTYISRYYIQPQWVFDSVNYRQLLPVEKYFLGVILPPHISPFTDDSKHMYKPIEEMLMKHPELKEQFELEQAGNKMNGKAIEKNEETKKVEKVKKNKKEDENKDSSKETPKLTAKEMLEKMRVEEGKKETKDPWQEARLTKEEFKLREKMIKNKHRKLYRNIMESKKKRAKEIWLLRKKRRLNQEKEQTEEVKNL